MSARRPVRLLPEETVRRIAAGEVIVRPANAVKELIENSLDAGATDIRVEIKLGGKNLIKVSDNGCGMTRDDVRLAVARHATSKIDTAEDLTRISSYGFRGEALASIAAVTRLTVETNADDSGPGTGLEIEGGEIKGINEVARPRGTTITGRMLFYNLPVRRAFMKSDNYEARLVVETVRNYAICYPGIGFTLVSNEREVMRLGPTGSVKDRIKALFEKRVVESLVEMKVLTEEELSRRIEEVYRELASMLELQEKVDYWKFIRGKDLNETVARAVRFPVNSLRPRRSVERPVPPPTTTTRVPWARRRCW